MDNIFLPAAKHAMPPSRRPNTAPEPPGLFGNLNLRFVGHAPEALDRVIIEGDVTWFKSLDPWNQRGNPRSYGAIPELPDTYIIHHGPPEGFLHWPLKSYRAPIGKGSSSNHQFEVL